MPQLDKLSFSTQYFWLTLFFFILYFICANFFVIVVFKNLKLRNIIYKVWYFFIYKFDYSSYEAKNKKLNTTSFNTYYSFMFQKFLNLLNAIKFRANLNLFKYPDSNLNNLLISKMLIEPGKLVDLKDLNIDEI